MTHCTRSVQFGSPLAIQHQEQDGKNQIPVLRHTGTNNLNRNHKSTNPRTYLPDTNGNLVLLVTATHSLSSSTAWLGNIAASFGRLQPVTMKRTPSHQPPRRSSELCCNLGSMHRTKSPCEGPKVPEPPWFQRVGRLVLALVDRSDFTLTDFMLRLYLTGWLSFLLPSHTERSQGRSAVHKRSLETGRTWSRQ